MVRIGSQVRTEPSVTLPAPDVVTDRGLLEFDICHRYRTTNAYGSTNLFFYLTTMDVVPSTMPTPSDFAEVRCESTTITSIVLEVSVIVTFFFWAGFYLVARRWTRTQDDTSLNEYSSVPPQRSASCSIFSLYPVKAAVTDSAPIVVCLVLALTNFVEISVSTWMFRQYNYNNHPSEIGWMALKLTLFYGCWTTLVAGCYSFLLLDPKLSRTSIASDRARAIAICLVSPLRIAIAAYWGASLSRDTLCIVYCRQLKGLFGISLAQTPFSAFAVYVVPRSHEQRIQEKCVS
ncbi:hypothetical protein BDM02DRAFT_1413488 [Thelephora ganbajun]|uniref:Uncharacterized protein n=1 Tax=Thelephora ganbajun TaxID=370292 RepID=A0ACB6Z1F3_THEGA|nr:hypothetical protein BDM02DRAFT_1413488 [Thelephora ganbajun]